MEYRASDAGRLRDYAGDLLHHTGHGFAVGPHGSAGASLEMAAGQSADGALYLDHARYTADAAVAFCLLCPADGRYPSAGHRCGTAGVHLELCGVFCRDLPRRYPVGTQRAV